MVGSWGKGEHGKREDVGDRSRGSKQETGAGEVRAKTGKQQLVCWGRLIQKYVTHIFHFCPYYSSESSIR